jgi:hypothetical protein
VILSIVILSIVILSLYKCYLKAILLNLFMNDIYRRPITIDENIMLILKELLNHNLDVCKQIIKKKII